MGGGRRGAGTKRAEKTFKNTKSVNLEADLIWNNLEDLQRHFPRTEGLWARAKMGKIKIGQSGALKHDDARIVGGSVRFVLDILFFYSSSGSGGKGTYLFWGILKMFKGAPCGGAAAQGGNWLRKRVAKGGCQGRFQKIDRGWSRVQTVFSGTFCPFIIVSHNYGETCF